MPGKEKNRATKASMWYGGEKEIVTALVSGKEKNKGFSHQLRQNQMGTW